MTGGGCEELARGTTSTLTPIDTTVKSSDSVTCRSRGWEPGRVFGLRHRHVLSPAALVQ